jgi:hypothetical protein
MPDFSNDQSNKIQVLFKRGYYHTIKVQLIEDPLLRTQVDPILALSGSWQIGKKDFQAERGKRSTHKKCNNFYSDPVAMLRICIHLIRIQHFRLNSDPDPIQIQGFDNENEKNIYSWKNIFLYNQKLQFTYLKASIKNV